MLLYKWQQILFVKNRTTAQVLRVANFTTVFLSVILDNTLPLLLPDKHFACLLLAIFITIF